MINGLAEDTLYSIKICSNCSDGSQPYETVYARTVETQVSCTAPTATVSSTSSNSISLSWNETDADSYRVSYKASNASDWQNETGLTTNSYVISDLASETTYDIRVYSICSDGSEPFASLTATTDESQNNCTAPIVTVTDTTADTLSFSWNDTGANSYIVYYRVSSGSWEKESELNSTNYALTGLTANTTYEIAVVAYCPDGSYLYEIITAETDDSGDTGDKELSIDDVLGQYVRQPPTNSWHTGVISESGDTLTWTNDAGRSWTLVPDLDNEQLLTTDDCPYPGKIFTLEVETNSNSSVNVTGFRFLNELYSR